MRGQGRSATCRFCCKSPFAPVTKNFPGSRRDFRVKMRGTSSSDDKLADDLGNAIEGRRISDRRSVFLQQENWRRAFWDFFNNICHNRTSRSAANSTFTQAPCREFRRTHHQRYLLRDRERDAANGVGTDNPQLACNRRDARPAPGWSPKPATPHTK